MLRLLPQQGVLFPEPVETTYTRLPVPPMPCVLCGRRTTRGEVRPAWRNLPARVIGWCLPCWVEFAFPEGQAPTLIDCARATDERRSEAC